MSILSIFHPFFAAQLSLIEEQQELRRFLVLSSRKYIIDTKLTQQKFGNSLLWEVRFPLFHCKISVCLACSHIKPTHLLLQI